MKRFENTITPEGNITLPPEVRKELGLKPLDRVSIVLENNELRVRAEIDLEKWAGVVPALEPRRSWDAVRRTAWEDASAESGQ
jgi:AbrB family looped-hinge helix DNA binding protein